MTLRTGPGTGGLAHPGDLARLGGFGKALSLEERIEIMRAASTPVSGVPRSLVGSDVTVQRSVARSREIAILTAITTR